MKQHKLTVDECKQVAHFIAQRSLATIGELETEKATKQYLESYNKILNDLYDYNSTATD